MESLLDYSQITTQNEIDAKRRLAEKQYEHYSTDEIEHLQRLAKTDYMFLGHAILGYSRLSPNLHGHLFRWLKHHRNNRFKMILMPRSHYKSTCDHIDSIQSVLPALPGDVYPYDLGPECRIMIAHEVLEKAAQFIHEISEHFISNHMLMGLFPKLVPTEREQRINRYQLDLPRDSKWSEPTFEAFGVGGKAQGRHYDILKLDDIYGEAARDSAAERATTIQWFKGIQAFFIRLKYSHLWMVGTRYDLDDVYSVAIDDYGERMQYYIRKVKEEGSFIFPEEFDEEAVAILIKDVKTWNAWYLNDPYEGTKRFEQDWLAYFRKVEGADVIDIQHGSEGSVRHEYIEYDNLDRVLIFDPAVTGTFGVCVTGTDQNRVFVLESFRGSLKPPDQIKMLFNLVLRYKPRVVAIESVLFSALYQDILPYEMAQRKVYFNIVPVKPRKPGTGKLDKTERINILAPYFSSRRIFFNPAQVDILEEYKNYGMTTDIHVLDALAYGPELWRFVNVERFARYRQIERELTADRDPDTGYSKI